MVCSAEARVSAGVVTVERAGKGGFALLTAREEVVWKLSVEGFLRMPFIWCESS